MGESACLRRSLSQPSSSLRVSEEGDPLRALRESVSFGRFMTEPLDWEKWSAFSHNRYLEEAERFSKPGSVAQKKAYFEAQLKKKAAEQENAGNVSSVDSVLDEEAVDSGVICSEIDDSSFRRNESGNSELDKLEGNEKVNGGISVVGSPRASEKSEDQIQNKIPASRSERGNAKASPKASSSKIASRTKSFVKELIDKGNAKSLHMSIQYPSRAGEISKRTSPIVPKIRRSMNITASLDVSKNSSASSQEKPKASVVRALRKPSSNHNAEDKRDGETEPANGRGISKPRPSMASCPFSFKSGERAAKRKEFYGKLEERRNADEAMKKTPQTRYQIASVQPRSLASRRNPTPNKTRAANDQPRESRKSKPVENEQCKNRSITSNARENTSPNIQKPNQRFK